MLLKLRPLMIELSRTAALAGPLSRRGWLHLRAAANRLLPVVTRWLSIALVTPLYLSFETYAFLWARVQTHLHRLAPTLPDGTARLVFCAALSMALGIGLLAQMHSDPNLVLIMLAAAHGVFIHLRWQPGLRWCRRRLGIRPSRYIDPERPFAALDLGN